MTDHLVALTSRDVSARLRATCSDFALDVEVIYDTDTPASGTDIQRRIDALVQLPSPAWLLSIGGMELYFTDGVRLSNLALYADFAAATPEALVPLRDAPPVWLALPGFDLAEDDRFSVDAVVHVSIDRARGAVRLRLTEAGRDHRAYSLAHGLIVWVDAVGCLAGLVAHGIEWTGVPSGQAAGF